VSGQDALTRIEALVRALEASGDEETRARAQELLRQVLDLHQDGLGRLLEVLRGLPGGEGAADGLGRDPVVSHLLLLHGLHPRPVGERVEAALVALRQEGPRGRLEHLEDGVARVVVADGTGPAGRARIEEAVWAAAPDLDGVLLVAEQRQRLPLAETRGLGSGGAVGDPGRPLGPSLVNARSLGMVGLGLAGDPLPGAPGALRA
jgi:hypothetical protein